jgi:hypothetical protein
MMKKEELEKFKELYPLFDKEVRRVADILSNVTEYQEHDGSNPAFADKFVLEGDEVYWEGDEYWQFQGHEEHSGWFPIDYLSMTDEEIWTIVNDMNAKYEEEKKKKKEEKEARLREQRKAEYERLKEEFGE